jgi:hypothetical protein
MNREEMFGVRRVVGMFSSSSYPNTSVRSIALDKIPPILARTATTMGLFLC